MKLQEKKNGKLILAYIGDDHFSMPVYRDQYGKLWKDVELGDSEQPHLYSVTGDGMDGEPDQPIAQEFTIHVRKEFVSRDKRFRYQMLDRLRSDCEYYLGYGHRNPGCLWAKSEEAQIEEMKKVWDSFSDDEKPEWLTWKQIEKYERDIVLQKGLKPGARIMGNVAKNEMEIIRIKAAASGTENGEPSPITVLRDISTGREFFGSLEALKHCGITITKEPAFPGKWGAISDSLMCALLCRQTVQLNLSDGSSIRGTVESIGTECATIKKIELFRRIAEVPFGQVSSMFAA